MKRKLDVTPQARRDLDLILHWYRAHLGARSALKVAQTIQSCLRSLGARRVLGAPLAGSDYRRAIAKRHVVIFMESGDAIQIVRIVHGAQDAEAIVAKLGDLDK